MNIVLNNYKKGSCEYQLAEYVNNNPFQVVEKNISEISNILFVSNSSITRAVKKMGFKKYKEFRIFIAKKIVENKQLIASLRNENNLKELLTNTIINDNLAIEETLRCIDLDQFEKIIAEIISTKKVYLYGVGFSHFICNHIAKYFQICKLNAYSIINIYDSIEILTSSPSDLWIIVSISLTTREILFLLNQLTIYNKKKIILITSADKNQVFKNVKHILKIKSSYQKENDFFNSHSNIALLAIANLLINVVTNETNINKVKWMLDFSKTEQKWWKKNIIK